MSPLGYLDLARRRFICFLLVPMQDDKLPADMQKVE